MRVIAKASLYFLIIMVLSVYLPRLYDTAVSEHIERTHLFFSPVSKTFIYTEKVAEYDPGAAAKAEDHHADIVYKDQNGTYYDRLEFERLLPFIYYRNMELRGYLPITIDGRTFDRETIRQERRVLELAARNIGKNTPSEGVFPLFESMPDQAGLVFPDDRFRMTDTAMEFINADYNTVDPELTARFTAALVNTGFCFPARHVAGNHTILKPYDDGVFIVDAENSVFHVKRVKGEPVVVKTPVPQNVAPRHILIAESDRTGYRGLILGGENDLYLFAAKDYATIRLPLEGYDPERMDCKILFNPVVTTAVLTDTAMVRAVAMNRDFTPLARYGHAMSRAKVTWRHTLRDALFPFTLQTDAPFSRLKRVTVTPSPGWLSWGLPVGAVLAFAFFTHRKARQRRTPSWGVFAAIVATGIFGFIAALAVEEG